MELEALQQIHSEVRALGGQIVVLTPELERYTRALHRKLNLTFDILSDLHLKTADQFRLVFTLPDYLRELYKSFGSTLDRFNDEPEYRLPMPARYVIDKQGIIRHQVINDLPLGRSVDEALRMLDALIFHEAHGEVCPANWKAGAKGLQPTTEGLIHYLK